MSEAVNVSAEEVRSWLHTNGERSHLQVCAAFPMATEQSVRGALNYLRDTDQARGRRLKVSGRMTTHYTLTAKGRILCGGAAGPVPEHVAQPRQFDALNAPSYSGEDLARRVVRPGAYDAFTLPSLMGARRVYRNR